MFGNSNLAAGSIDRSRSFRCVSQVSHLFGRADLVYRLASILEIRNLFENFEHVENKSFET